jgi:hypothetical protein
MDSLIASRVRATFAALLVGTALMLTLGSTASAAPVEFELQTSPVALPTRPTLVVDTDNVTDFAITLRATQCTDSDGHSQNDYYELASSAPAALVGGAFVISGRGTSVYGSGYGVDFVFTGQVNPEHTKVTGTITLSNGTGPFVNGCSGTFAALAIPKSFGAETADIDRKAGYRAQNMSLNYKNGVVKDLRIHVNFKCDVWVNETAFVASKYGMPKIRTTASGTFKINVLAFDVYSSIVNLAISGVVRKKSAVVTVTISEPPGFTSHTGDDCAGVKKFTAKPRAKPKPPGPTAYFSWQAAQLRTVAGASYYIFIEGLRCGHRANAVRLTVGGHKRTVSCRKRAAWASPALSPGRKYKVSWQAVRKRNGRVVKRGTRLTEYVYLPGPGDDWSQGGSFPAGSPG